MNKPSCRQSAEPEVKLIRLGKSKRANSAVHGGIVYCSVKQLWRLDGVAIAMSYSEGMIPSLKLGRRTFVSIPWVRSLEISEEVRSVLNEMEAAVHAAIQNAPPAVPVKTPTGSAFAALARDAHRLSVFSRAPKRPPG